jgi:hypothetical protein
MTPIIDLNIHSDDTSRWFLTPRTDAADKWARTLGVPDWVLVSQGYFAAGGVNVTFEEVLASARAAGLVLSFTATREPMTFGAQ